MSESRIMTQGAPLLGLSPRDATSSMNLPTFDSSRASSNQQQVIAQQQEILARLRNQSIPVAPAQQVLMDSTELPPAVLRQIGDQLQVPPEVPSASKAPREDPEITFRDLHAKANGKA
ncbi:hypothetical protein LY78DRAFT_671007 [Colletotrichum sublineola]|nr:hypothetical protein LY78DRAFT_671007 [Colletotrichum sublineola]